MERGTVFVQEAHGAISWQPLQTPGGTTPPVTRFKARELQAQAVRDARCVHFTDGMYDLSAMTPFIPSTARTWNINF